MYIIWGKIMLHAFHNEDGKKQDWGGIVQNVNFLSENIFSC